MDTETLNQLLEQANSGTGTSISPIPDINAIMQSLAPYMIALTVVSALFTLLYLISVISKWRANKAVLDMKKILMEMNERDKLRGQVAVAPTSDIPVQLSAPIVPAPTE